MEENMNTPEQIQETTQQEKTFTQEEVNKVVQERLGKERAKFEDYDALKEKASKFDEMQEASKSELQKAQEKAAKLEAQLSSMKKDAEVTALRQKVAAEKGVPADLLYGETEEACQAQAEKLLAYKGETGYPVVKDAGEVRVNGKASTADQFKQWAEQTLN